jgi:hypothetical protein
LFHQNIGLLVVRLPWSIEGRLCKSCIHKRFWSMTATTLFLGWWGVISFLVTPFFLVNNIGRYRFCLGMAPTPPGARPPQLTDAAIDQIQPHADELFRRLNEGEDFAAVASSIAERAGVTPGQVVLFVQAVVRSQEGG